MMNCDKLSNIFPASTSMFMQAKTYTRLVRTICQTSLIFAFQFYSLLINSIKLIYAMQSGVKFI